MSDHSRKTVTAVLLAAGSSSRMGVNKMRLELAGSTPVELCIEAYKGIADEFVIAVSNSTYDVAEKASRLSSVPVKIVMGGDRRQDSVFAAIEAASCEIVSIHDCARCLITKKVIADSVSCAEKNGCGIASVKVVDTIRNAETGDVIDREALLGAQTPQSFEKDKLIKAYRMNGEGLTFTDDAALYKHFGNELFYSVGDKTNLKLTTADDIELFKAVLDGRKNKKGSRPMLRIGYGEDTHRLISGRKLILGGVEVPFETGLDGHSDADVLTHALIDAVLGAAALGDIGQHFPDTSSSYKDINSLILAERAAKTLAENGYRIINIDATLIAQRPKLASYRDAMRENIAVAFGIDKETVSIKFTTPEHTGPEGRGESMTARAAAMIEKV